MNMGLELTSGEIEPPNKLTFLPSFVYLKRERERGRGVCWLLSVVKFREMYKLDEEYASVGELNGSVIGDLPKVLRRCCSFCLFFTSVA